ncbi:MAG: type II toxin-antitoxin system HicB family antitoxin [Candidatus Roizmanbacteria bacterium]|nr:type II toxin-antitoxin system HicB family antitoxin [Candidatus Roizmanbacteria bacterium]
MEKNVLNYRIIIEPETYEDGSTVYVAHCPTLGISDYGDSIDDALKSIQSGIELAVEHLAKEKKEVPIDHIDRQIITSMGITPPKGRNVTYAS